MIDFPNAKINLGLNIKGKRPDGFHEIETILFPVKLNEALEIIASPGEEFSFNCSGTEIPPSKEGNICSAAWLLMKEKFNLPPVQIYLHKYIPVGAGLGGGSSDGAFTLKIINSLFHLGLSAGQLHEMAARLGSDCPFFLDNKPALAKGRGELLSPIEHLNLKGWHLVILVPPLHISTPWAYQNSSPGNSETPLPEITALPVEHWKDHLINDFEKSIFLKHPVLKEIKENLYESGATYAAMSGSGSSLFGLFKEKPPALLSNRFKGLFYHKEVID